MAGSANGGHSVRLLPCMRMGVVILVLSACAIMYGVDLFSKGWSHLSRFETDNLILVGIAIVLLPLAIAQMIVSRYVAKEYVSFDEEGMFDYMSSRKLGKVTWQHISAVQTTRTPLGSKVLIRFKGGQHSDGLLIQPLEISKSDQSQIEDLFENSRQQHTNG